MLRGDGNPRLLRPVKRPATASRPSVADSWEGVDRGLFDELRRLRQEKAAAEDVPPYIVFGDAALRDMARRRPSTLEGFRQVKGVGDKKLADYGQAFLSRIADYCRANQTTMDVQSAPPAPSPFVPPGPTIAEVSAFKFFRQGLSVTEVAQQMGRALSTTYGYLSRYIEHEGITDASPWVAAAAAQRIAEAAEQLGTERLKPIFEQLEGQTGYEKIRIVIQCLRNAAAQ
jgi:ATP-dependent DNA helicase RecQ